MNKQGCLNAPRASRIFFSVIITGVAILLATDAFLPHRALGVEPDANVRAVDASLAEKAEEGSSSAIPMGDFARMIKDGGFIMFPIVLSSLMLVTVVLERMTALRRNRIVPKAFATRLLRQVQARELDADAALE